MAWGSQKIGPIAIDLGSATLRMLQMGQSGGQLQVIAAAQASTPPALTGTIIDRHSLDEAKELIKRQIRDNRFRGRDVITSVPLSDVRIKSFRLPCMPEAELEQAVTFEASQRFHSLDDEPEVRYYNAGKISAEGGDQYELIVLAVPGDVLRKHLAVLQECGLFSVAVEFGPAAAFRPFARFLQRNSDEQQTTGLFEIGYNSSRLLIARGTEASFLKVFSSGMKSLVESIAQGLDVSLGEAIALFESLCVGGDGHHPLDTEAESRRNRVLSAMSHGFEQIGKEISLCLRYFSVTFRGSLPSELICVGGGARSDFVLSRLSDIISLPTRVGDPLRSIDTQRAFTGADRRCHQPEWSHVAGLALHGLMPRSAAEPQAETAVSA